MSDAQLQPGEVALRVEDLRIDVVASGVDIVDDISFSIPRGQVLGVVGESGSGKTTAGLAVLGHVRRGARIVRGSAVINGKDVLAMSHEERRRARGSLVSYVPQDPAASLNPALRIGTQLIEVLEAHDYGGSDAVRRERIAETMREVLLPDDPAYLKRYPHQLSGGQQQRVGLAMAFACRPAVIVLDEPTTGLDVTTQSHVLDTVRDLTKLHGASALYVTHDLAVVATLADRVAVMYAGRLVEEGAAEQIFRDPAHPYTHRLLAAIPHIQGRRALVGIPGRAPSPGSRPQGCSFAPRCMLAIDACRAELPALVEVEGGHRARCIRVADVRGTAIATGAELGEHEQAATDAPVLAVRGVSISYTGTQVVHDIEFALARRECLALVGESGSGKTTLARTIAGLHRERVGEILLDGEPLAPSARGRSREVRRRIQYVFQNPYGSLNPRRTIGDSVRRPLALLGLGGKEADARVGEMLERVSLSAAYAERYPDQLSGGERQRVAIARALVCDPEILVCDEVTSALDVSVQAAIVDLLAGLQRDLGLSMLFVTHNLPLVRSIAQRVAVMQEGRIVELGDVDAVLGNPHDAYTQRLLSDTPQIAPVTA
jgi:peptide/nickel transport system ATP-binding protein